MVFNESNHAHKVSLILVYCVAALVILIMLVLCLSYVQHLLMNSSPFRKNAYSNLVKHGFFEVWIIQDLYGLIYNPRRIQNSSRTNYESVII